MGEVYLSGSSENTDTTLVARLKKLKTNRSPHNERFLIMDSILLPILADLTNQTGLIHKTRIHDNGTDYAPQYYRISLFRQRPNTGGFWNWLARNTFWEYQKVLTIGGNHQLWICSYFVSYYFMTAQRIRDEYYDKLREAFGGYDMVIVGN